MWWKFNYTNVTTTDEVSSSSRAGEAAGGLAEFEAREVLLALTEAEPCCTRRRRFSAAAAAISSLVLPILLT